MFSFFCFVSGVDVFIVVVGDLLEDDVCSVCVEVGVMLDVLRCVGGYLVLIDGGSDLDDVFDFVESGD